MQFLANIGLGGEQIWGGVGSSYSASSLDLPTHPKAPLKGLVSFKDKCFKSFFGNLISLSRTCYVCFNCKNFEHSQAKECDEGEDFCLVSIFAIYAILVFWYFAKYSFSDILSILLTYHSQLKKNEEVESVDRVCATLATCNQTKEGKKRPVAKILDWKPPHFLGLFSKPDKPL